jgi:SAM-dependent methyltransferase
VSACTACGAAEGQLFFARDDVPVHQNLLCDTPAEARAVRRGDLRLALCPRCGLVWNAAFDPGRLTYEGHYDSNQSCSAVFLRHVDDLVGRLAEGRTGRRVVEVGCGSGYFLQRVCAAADGTGVGYDPGYAGPPVSPDGRVRFVRGLFRAEGDAALDVLLCRHVIEHVPRPADFAAEVAGRLPARVQVYFETPSLEWILENGAFWDLFYEHCNYFTAEALANVLRLAGLAPESVERVFERQYFFARARPGAAPARAVPQALPDVAAFARGCAREQRRLRLWIEELAGAGRLAVWGAAAKGATLANLLDPERRLVHCLTDVNPARHGRFVAGSGHPIVPPGELAGHGISDVLVVNPNYADEVRAQLAQLGHAARVCVLGAP